MSAVAATAGVKQTTTATGNNATGGPSRSNSPRVLRTGTLYVRERGAFGKAWKSKGVELDEKHLTIHQSSSGRHIQLPLGSITELERTDLMPHSLSIKCAGKVYHIAFDSDGDLYDWQDDMYSRSRLGAQTTSPFDFKHTGHIGSGGASGTFADSTLPLYEEMIGRSAPAVIEGSTAASLAIASRTRSSTLTAARRRSNPPVFRANVALNNNNNANIEGIYFIKQSGGVFAGWYWKERWLSLKGNSLTVHTRKTKASPPAKEIPLSTIKSVEPDPKRRNSLIISTSSRETCISILFDTDNDLYAWREAIYLRSAMSTVISPPTDFVHAMHVTYDESTGELKGLPDQWKSVLYPAGHSAHIVSLPIQANLNTNGTSRSSRRRSQPTFGKLESSRLMSPNSSTLFANMSRVPPPLSSSADTQSTGFAGTPRSRDSRFLAGTSADSDGTLFSVSPQNAAMMSIPKEAS